jgi:DNA polymerase IV
VWLELPLDIADEGRRPGTRKGMARWSADRAVDAIRGCFGGGRIRVRRLGTSRSVPEAFRELAEKEL